MTAAPPASARIRFDRFVDSDATDLAALLADPEITRCITANASSPERCASFARKRIAWHNAAWESRGYGVWALRWREKASGPVIGWCGFAEPEHDDHDPEILYGLARACWGQGLATEAAAAAVGWFFDNTDHAGVTAVLFGCLNPGSVAVTKKLGMTPNGTMPVAEFLSDEELGRELIAYETWRLREGDCLDPEALLFQVPYKLGQVVGAGIGEASAVETALRGAARLRPAFTGRAPNELDDLVRAAFAQGQEDDGVDCFRVTRETWQVRQEEVVRE